VSDLYLVYEGKNETTGRPSSKPRQSAGTVIWIGLIIMVFGTIMAWCQRRPVRVTAAVPTRTPAQVGAGD